MKKNSSRIFKGILAASAAIGVFATVPSAVSAAGEIKYTVETKDIHTINESAEGTTKVDFVTNPNNGPILGILHNTDGTDGKNKYILEEVDGDYTYAFKDMNKNGSLDAYEDWRLDVDTRAEALANYLVTTDPDGIKKIAGLMLFSSHESNSKAGLTQSQKKYLTDSYVRNITDAAGNDVSDSVGWTNAMQAFVETSDFNVPVDFSSDPRSTAGSGDLYSSAAEGSDISAWPSNLGMAATFSTEHMYNFAKATSAEYRAMGIVTALGPQIDLATEPRWLRVGGTFGENTALATAMAQAYVDGSQSSYDGAGNDLGWGSDSINAMIKHFPGDGAGEGGRESHTAAGKYAVYPGGNYDEHLLPFTEGGMKLNGKTGSATAVMTSYSIGVDADGNSQFGDQLVGSAYNIAKMSLLRDTDKIGFDGVVCTDWGVTSFGGFGMAWGAEALSTADRHYEILMAGTDMFGGNNNAEPIVLSYNRMVSEKGKAWADNRFATSAKRLIKLTMQPGMFENPYLDVAASEASAGNAEKMQAGYNAQLDSIVMLKNADNTIQAAANNEKDPKSMKVYIPMVYTKEQPGIFGSTPAGWAPSMNLDVARSIYGEVITDNGNDTDGYTVPDLTGVDKVIVGIRSPMNGGLFSNTGRYTKDDGSYGYYPLSLQYGDYVADGENVRKESIAGDTLDDGSKENRSYYGETSRLINSHDLDIVLNAVEAVEKTGKDIPIVVAMNASGPAIVSEFEDKVDAIVVGFSVSDAAIHDVINGNHEPKGLLPMQFPRDMDTVEANLEDVGEDVIPYLDTQGNTYDVAYGLNWAGLIDDDRVATYNPSRPTTLIDKLVINANNFKLNNDEASKVTAEILIKKAGANAKWTKTRARANEPVDISVDAAQVAAIKKAGKAGGEFDVTFTATSGSTKETITVKGVVAAGSSASTSTGAGSGTNTGDTTDFGGYAMAGILAFLVAAGILAKRKRARV
ncbi:beta-glucosidase [Breznakia sp. PF5-3]|uniref:glycoside hydrolase family 3 N-terminal domain-containing protein n=1 Tax=unclassified Breznakia TaxID=2623764 RepID=UPI002406FAC9|nr:MULTISPECIES: glycoside hydrolase family 3 N-terminal domain-containing protein [unclassified Breznakia]MDF9824048.1 beta-glucosidase [Breznakia sp. PM6-1]MDF9834886.1 beta-glucosidase [Breznakia sp. PF5-3]MDF9837092.1 beta-glucosidase [Breznakia sp. PFB2-8]MDF9859017.1 beta-glucosidase [Breznakia sp. PH5-24]